MYFTMFAGIGLFLLGMILLTDGLKTIAGRTLKRLLTRFVGGPISGMVTGAGFTALVQSSSATTLTTIGFVSAGLITLPQAIGVIFGANIGTTSTGWIVSVLGLKVSLGAVSPPLILVGVLMRLFMRDQLAGVGGALAGFGLIFYGIDVLQTGMLSIAEQIDLNLIQAEGLTGRLTLVGVGVIMTVLLQSSSAAIAATLVAMSAGVIDLPQAAALVIGQNIGTTVTAGIAAIGASVAAKRTAVAHTLFNLITGCIAFTALPVFVWSARAVSNGIGGDPGPTAIAVFHTIFNVLGVAVLLPFVTPFSRMVSRLVPQRGPALTENLDPTVATLGAVGLQAASQAAARTLAATLHAIRRRTGFSHERVDDRDLLAAARLAIPQIRTFVAQLSRSTQSEEEIATQANILHAVDHIAQIVAACDDPAALSTNSTDPALAEFAKQLESVFTLASNWDEGEAGPEVPDQIATVSRNIATMRRDRRRDLLHAVAAGEADPGASADLIETIRWIDSTAYHVARAIDHLADLDQTSVHSLAFESPSDPMVDAAPARSDNDDLSR